MADGDAGIQPSTLRCAQCAYDLTGATIGGRCPECGMPVDASIQALVPKHSFLLPPNNAAQCSLGFGIASVFCLPPLGILAIILGVMARRQIACAIYRPSARIQADIGILCGLITILLWGLVLLTD